MGRHNGNPVSPKVASASVAAAVATVLMYILDTITFINEMPEVVKGALLVLVTSGLTFLAGYMRRDPLRRTGV